MRNLPHYLEAEVSILGACLVYPELINRAVMELSEEDFYDERNRTIFSVIKLLQNLTPRLILRFSSTR